ncbi:collagen triple helix repeat-containing protein 1-like isoform X1 [Branchiostoma floridae]|uniref:Collagen triple helix repeat-containing protein 1-like isoform X1 n=1 Tax=Branchiostoma floridae TaxID=7739 RepID=A0A9J7M0D2_BRAFL|nr:collagen triple helix repeat-containing protein 1-like isoform X1 [Branchiostoma floridae]
MANWTQALTICVLCFLGTRVWSAPPEGPDDSENEVQCKQTCPGCCPMGAPGMPGRNGVPGQNGYPGSNGFDGIAGKGGTRGVRGVNGIRGQKGEPGDSAPDLVASQNIKHCVWDRIKDDRDSGTIKICRFHKRQMNTTMHVTWNGSLRVLSTKECCKRWYFTFNGRECLTPVPIDGLTFTNGAESVNIHRVTTIEGLCENVPQGPVDVAFNVQDCRGYSGGDAYTGWNSVSRIIAEELPVTAEEGTE